MHRVECYMNCVAQLTHLVLMAHLTYQGGLVLQVPLEFPSQ